MPNFRYTPSAEAIELIGTTDKEGRVYEVFREAMDLNLEFGSSTTKLVPGGPHRPFGDQPGPLAGMAAEPRRHQGAHRPPCTPPWAVS